MKLLYTYSTPADLKATSSWVSYIGKYCYYTGGAMKLRQVAYTVGELSKDIQTGRMFKSKELL